jgi:N6-adenosine-specific RNA methylase IME4
MEQTPFPNKKYQIIYADPPWSYNDKMSGHSFSLDHEYETQSKQWISGLPVGELAEKKRLPISVGNKSVA